MPQTQGICRSSGKYVKKLGQHLKVVSLDFGRRDHRHDRLWLVDEPFSNRFFYRSIHADIGYVILLLTVIRLLWRGINPTPELPDDTPRWQRLAARISHWALYLTTILVAMLGWAMSGARTQNYASWFGLFNVPQFTSPDKAAANAYEERHIL